MKIGIIVLCRISSSRLPGKVLKEIMDKPVLMYIFERLLKVTQKDNIVCATSTEKSDDLIEDFCKLNDINIYRGSLENVAERFLECSKYYDLDYAVRITGDSIFVDIETLKRMIEVTKKDTYDFITNRIQRTFPIGMSIEIVRVSFFEDVFSKFSKSNHYEHVTMYLYQNIKLGKYFNFINDICPGAAGIQLAIDSENDLILAQKIVEKFEYDHTKYGLKEIFNLYKEIKNNENI